MNRLTSEECRFTSHRGWSRPSAAAGVSRNTGGSGNERGAQCLLTAPNMKGVKSVCCSERSRWLWGPLATGAVHSNRSCSGHTRCDHRNHRAKWKGANSYA